MTGYRERKLGEFVGWTSKHISGDEKGEAQIFLDRMFQAFGQRGLLEVGGHPEFRIRKSKEDGGGTAFADYVWKPIVLIEMKKGGEDLNKHYRQAFDYWIRLVPDRPRYVVLCNFNEFWVYDFETQMDIPVDKVTIDELPSRYGPLAFLFPTKERPVFGNDQEAVTREAADLLAKCFNKLISRDVKRSISQRFILQMLIALFAEDIGLLDRYMVARLLDECNEPQDSYELLGSLFTQMNTPGKTGRGRFKGVDYFNGGVFTEPVRIELYPDEVNQLKEAARADWSKVQPEIFGTLFEHSLEKSERHAYGAYFTSPVDIMKIVGPTIVEPWREQIESAKTLERLNELQNRMHSYKVLDPACGSGNFLYIAYRELKRLEVRLYERMHEISRKHLPGQLALGLVTASQFYGIDINPFAVELAKVTIMIGRKLAIDELHINEHPLPLDNLDNNFIAGDALIDSRGIPVSWPEADVIIGNPPYLGAKRLKPTRGTDYVNAVRNAYPEVPAMADYCVYWFRKAHDHLPKCTANNPTVGRAGLVGTQNIRSGKSRAGGLDYVLKTGTIIECVDNQPWSGEANVHVSIANWMKTKNAELLPEKHRLWYQVSPTAEKKKIQKHGKGPAAKEYELAYRDCEHINSSLSDQTDVSSAKKLVCNTKPKCVFQGMTPGYAGFVISPATRGLLISKDTKARKIIRPYLIGRELVSGKQLPQRFIIDADHLDIITLTQFSSINQHLKEQVLPEVGAKLKEVRKAGSDMVKARMEHLDRWWTFWARRSELRKWMKRHHRIIAASRTQRWPFIFDFISTDILPGDKLQLFAIDDDYSFGIIQADPHCFWYQAKGARLKNEADYNYSSYSVFETFPWPQSPSVKEIDAVAEAGHKVRSVRAEALKNIKGGLRAVYRTLELPGKNPLKDAHAALNAAVLSAYGFSGEKSLLAQLLELNLDVAQWIDAGKGVTPPGIPPNYTKQAKLVTGDRIRIDQNI